MNTKHCTSLELSQRLAKLGCKQKSLFFWAKYDDGKYAIGYDEMAIERECAAFLASELMEMLPQLKIKNKWYVVICYQFMGIHGWKCDLLSLDMKNIYHSEVSITMPEAMGLMLAYLIENGLITDKI